MAKIAAHSEPLRCQDPHAPSQMHKSNKDKIAQPKTGPSTALLEVLDEWQGSLEKSSKDPRSPAFEKSTIAVDFEAAPSFLADRPLSLTPRKMLVKSGRIDAAERGEY
jgi:hypothetical protein